MCGKKGHYANKCPENGQDKGKDGVNSEKDGKEEQSGIQMLVAACESNEFDDQDAGFFFHQVGISEQCMDYMSNTMSPRVIVTGTTMDYGHHCQLEFGEYVQMHEEHDNLMNTQTTGGDSTPTNW